MKPNMLAQLLGALIVLIPLLSSSAFANLSCRDLFLKPPTPVRGVNPFINSSREQILQTLRALDAVIAVNARSISNDRSPEGKEVILNTARVHGTASQLFNYITRIRGDKWREWLNAAGLAHRDHGVGTTNPFHAVARETLLALLKELDGVIDINAKSIYKDRSTLGRDTILEKAGVTATASQLHAYVVKVLGEKWTDWLKEANLQHRYQGTDNPFRQMTNTQVYELLKTLDGRIPLNARALQTDRSAETSDLLFLLTGVEGSAAQFYYYVRYILKRDWESTIRSLELDRHIRRTARQPLTDEQIVSAIKVLHSSGHSLNRNAMVLDRSEASARAIKSELNIYLTAAQIIYQIGAKQNANERIWDYWLVKAGLNPLEIRRRGTTPFHLLSSSLKGEIDSNMSALVRGGTGFEGTKDGSEKVAIDPTTPEHQVMRAQFHDALSHALKGLSQRENQLFDLMLSYFETRSPSQLSEMGPYLREHLKPEPSDSEWHGLLAKISKDEELRQHLLDVFN